MQRLPAGAHSHTTPTGERPRADSRSPQSPPSLSPQSFSSYGFPPSAHDDPQRPAPSHASVHHARDYSSQSHHSSVREEIPQGQAHQQIRASDPEKSSQKSDSRPKNARQPSNTVQPARGFNAWIHRAVGTKLQWTYLGVLACQSLAILALQGIVFGLVEHRVSTDTAKLKAVRVYLAIFIFAELYQLFLAFDALRLKNTLQLYGLLVFDAAMLVYSALIPSQLEEALNITPSAQDVYDDIKGPIITIPILIGVVLLVLIGLSIKISAQFGWSVFKLLGASLHIKKLFFYYQILVTLLKFDLFFFIGFALQFILLVTGTEAYEVALTIIGLPIIIAICIIGAISVRIESKAAFAVYGAGLVAAMVYFVWKLVRIFTKTDEHGNNPYSSNERSLALFSSVSIVLLAGTMVVSLIVFFNFGKGLKDALPRYSSGRRRKGKNESPGVKSDDASIIAEERMTID